MKRFVIAAALATVVGLSLTSTANAQFVRRNYGYAPNGGFVTQTTVGGRGGYQTYNTYLSPTGLSARQATSGADIYGNRYGFSNGYSLYSGYGYNRGYYSPSPFVSPSGLYPSGFNYNFVNQPGLYPSGFNYNYYGWNW
jgi:hypothetical protein